MTGMRTVEALLLFLASLALEPEQKALDAVSAIAAGLLLRLGWDVGGESARGGTGALERPMHPLDEEMCYPGFKVLRQKVQTIKLN